ncbi:hypothetical protein CDIK_1431 [Cucumispora dikerogammari]|nr:hypothetical protein CDIK_1431 [Cucumispora dikerogammari]
MSFINTNNSERTIKSLITSWEKLTTNNKTVALKKEICLIETKIKIIDKTQDLIKSNISLIQYNKDFKELSHKQHSDSRQQQTRKQQMKEIKQAEEIKQTKEKESFQKKKSLQLKLWAQEIKTDLDLAIAQKNAAKAKATHIFKTVKELNQDFELKKLKNKIMKKPCSNIFFILFSPTRSSSDELNIKPKNRDFPIRNKNRSIQEWEKKEKLSKMLKNNPKLVIVRGRRNGKVVFLLPEVHAGLTYESKDIVIN